MIDLKKLTEKYSVLKVSESGSISVSPKEVQKMEPADIAMMCLQLTSFRLSEMNETINKFNAKHDDLSEYTHRIQILSGKLDKIDGNIFEIQAGGIFFGGHISEEDYEKANGEAYRIHTESDAAARMYNVMISELNNKYSPITKEIPPDVKAIEIVKLKYEKLFTVLKYRMLEFDVLNNPNDEWRKEPKGRLFVTHDYFGSSGDDPEDVTVDNLDELKNEKYTFKRPEQKRDSPEPQTEYEKWQEEQFQKEFDKKCEEFKRKYGKEI